VALSPVCVVSTVAAVLLFVFAPQAGHLIVRGDSGNAVVYLRLLAPCIPLAAAYDVLIAATRGLGTMRPTVLTEKIGRPTLQLMLVAIAAVLGGGAWLAFAWVAPYVAAAIVTVYAVRRLVRRRSGVQRPQAHHAIRARFWRFAGPRGLASVAQTLLQRLDIVMVAAMKGATPAAIYAAATRFLVVGQLAGQAINLTIQPKLSELLAQRKTPEAGVVYRTSTAWLVCMAWPLYLLTALSSAWILRIFGHGYRAGTSVVVVLGLVMLLATICGSVDTVLNMAGKTSWNLMNTILALTVNVSLNLLLIPHLGILGAALSWAAAIAVNNVVPLIQVHWFTGLHPFGRGTVIAGLLTASCFGAWPLAFRAVAGTGPVAMLFSVASAGALYAGGLFLFREELELDAFRGIVRRRGGTARTTARPASLEPES
jgi:O-antigen/teichoic acid export membrane protein